MSVSVLLVEDNIQNLKAKKGYLDTFDCGPVLGVRDPDEAIHAIRSLPHFDLVIADIDLSQGSKKKEVHNKGGVAVAKWLKETGYPAYVAGYSSFFEGDEISESERSVFNDIVDRSVGFAEQNKKMETWIKSAAGNDRSSILRDLLFEAFEASKSEQKERHVPVVSLDTLVDYDGDEVSEIRKNGFSLSLLLPDVDEEIRKAFPIWVKREASRTYIEVVGQPYLFAEGKSQKDAQEALRSLILGYYEDLRDKDSSIEMGSYVKIMFSFIESLLK